MTLVHVLTHKTPNGNAYKSTLYCMKKIQYSNSIKVRICITVKSFLTTRGQERSGSNSPPSVRALVICFLSWIRNHLTGLPWWLSGWGSACQCRGHGFEPWSGKIPHAAEQLGPWATTTEPAPLEPVLRNKRGRDSERPAHRDEEWPPLAATRESPHTETKTQHSQNK